MIVLEISIDEFKELLEEGINVIDIREHYLFERSHVKTAINIPLRILRMMPNKYLTTNKSYYLICETGFNSKRLAEILNEKGYTVYSVKNGYDLF